MSGHSKWAQIKRQKGVNDARRGQLFTKLGREITVAARQGGGDPDANFRLRLAIQHARENNMPHENIERAIKRGVGGGEGTALEEIVYEGYGPGGVAIMVQVLSDNRNRAAAEVRTAFNRGGGNLGENGCVAWLFEPRGVINVTIDGRSREDAELAAIDAGAVDIEEGDGSLEVYTELGDLDAVRRALVDAGLTVTRAETTMVPKTTITLDEQAARQTLRLVERLEDLDDVQHVYSNLELSDELVTQMAS